MKKLFLTLITTALAAGSLSAHSQDYTWDAGDDLTGWLAYINAFDTDCSTYRGYGYGYTVNPDGAVGGQVVQLTAEGYMNVFSNYDDGNQPNICLETNVYREVVITAGDEGDYRMNFEPIPPASVGANTQAFVKVLRFADYGDTGLTAYAATPANGTVVASIGAADLTGGDLRVQFGFQTVAAGYDDSGMTYDAIAFGEGLAAPAGGGGGVVGPAPDVTPVPALPLWGLFGLAGLVGLLGIRFRR